MLDERVISEPLGWLEDKNYGSVRAPFKKSLSHLLESLNKHERRADAFTDAYEALEALSQIVTGRSDRDLSANRELLISRSKLDAAYSVLLKDYIDLGNKFRHAPGQTERRPTPSAAETEAFVYLTGVFLRAIQVNLDEHVAKVGV